MDYDKEAHGGPVNNICQVLRQVPLSRRNFRGLGVHLGVDNDGRRSRQDSFALLFPNRYPSLRYLVEQVKLKTT